MRYSTSRVILEKLSEIGEVLFDGFFPWHYAMSQPTRWLLGMDGRKKRTLSRESLSSALGRLKRQGLVGSRGRSHNSRWHITEQGMRALEDYKIKNILPLLPKEDGITRLVIFDIPEKERKKRDTVRAELIAYNFRQLQKSVWMGVHALPEEFVMLIDELDLKEKVHIFSVHHEGTLDEADNTST